MQDDNDNEVADALRTIGVHLKYLGVGDAATTMGAIECLAVQMKESGQAVASALYDLAEAVREGLAGLDAVAEAITAAREDLRSDHPLQGETFNGLTEALDAIAQAIDQHGSNTAED
jgi:hypothetical protein